MVTYTAKKKKDLIIAGSVLTGLGVVYVAGSTILISNKLIEIETEKSRPLAVSGLLTGLVSGGELFLIPGIVCLSLGLASKTK